VAGEIDLIEEVARHCGYNRLPSRVKPAPPRITGRSARAIEVRISDILVGTGYREIIPPAMIDPEENARFTDRPPVVLANPLSQDASAMRSSAIPSMVRALKWNLDRYQNDVRLAELGRIYISRPEGLPEEKRVLTLGATGRRMPPSLCGEERRLDFFDLKGDMEAILGVFELPGLTFEPSGSCYHEPGLGGRFVAGEATVALLGRLNDSLARHYKLRQDAWLAEIDLDFLLETPLRHPSFKPISKFPAVERDFSLIVPETLSYAKLEAAVRGLGLEEMQSIIPVDRRRSAELAAGTIPGGHLSLLLRIIFQSPTHTLASEEIEARSRRVVQALEPLGVRLRA
jgi:phenylalanyl-tRNA synthetase beta chain